MSDDLLGSCSGLLYVINGAKPNMLRQQWVIFHVSVAKLGQARWFILKVCHAFAFRSGWGCGIWSLDEAGYARWLTHIDVSWSCLSAEKSSGTSYSMMADSRRIQVKSKCEAGIRRNVQDSPEDYPYIWHMTTSIILYGWQDLPRFKRQRGPILYCRRACGAGVVVLAILEYTICQGAACKWTDGAFLQLIPKANNAHHTCVCTHTTYTRTSVFNRVCSSADFKY